MIITKAQARKFLVVYHHLHPSNPINSEEGLLAYIKKVGCIQFDPINVLAYNSHLVLQSRIPNYEKGLLDRLIYEDCVLIDAWDKNLSIYHIEDDPSFHRYRARRHRYYNKEYLACEALVPMLKQKIKDHGPISSLDIKDSPTIKWSWAPTKAVRAALDLMFSNGEIYVHHKVNTRKYYDLIEHHPNIVRISEDFADDASYFRWHIERRIGGVGLLPAYRDSYGLIAIDGLTAKIRRQTVKDLLDLGRITELHIEGVHSPYYIRTEDLDLYHQLDHYTDESPVSHIIAALDNLVWDREMVEEIFDFRYRWEVYVPEVKRVYGYYVLPILYGYELIGRVVMKYNRQRNTLEIHQWYFEKGVLKKNLDLKILGEMLFRFSTFVGSEDILVLEEANHLAFVRKLVAIAKKLQK